MVTQIHRNKRREPEMLNKNVHITKALLSSASLKDIQLYKVFLIRYVWVCNIYGCNMYNNNAIKREEIKRAIQTWHVYISLELSKHKSEAHSDKLMCE